MDAVGALGRVLLGACLAVSVVAPVAAESTPFRWNSHADVAAGLSNGLVASAVTLDTWHAYHGSNRRHALLNEACRLGLTIAVTEIVKHTVHRTRPDGSDDMSFWSGHTAVAMEASGWRYSIGVPIAIGTGYFRMAAGKHYFSDVAAGAGMGLLSQWVCRGAG